MTGEYPRREAEVRERVLFELDKIRRSRDAGLDMEARECEAKLADIFVDFSARLAVLEQAARRVLELEYPVAGSERQPHTPEHVWRAWAALRAAIAS